MRIVAILLLVVGFGFAHAVDLERAKGLSAHFLPKGVAEADKSSGVKWGFIASTAETRSQLATNRPTFQSVTAFLAHYKQLGPETQRNGIWIVTTNPAAYSSEENAMLEELKRQCKAQRIPLFIAEGRICRMAGKGTALST